MLAGMHPGDPPGASEPGEGVQASSHQRLDDLERVTEADLAYLSLEDLLSELLDRIRERLGADTAAILLLDEDRGVLLARAAKGIEDEVRSGVQIPLERGFAGRIAAERIPIAIEDTEHADIYNPLLRQKGIKSLLGVPLLVDGGRRVIGVLHVGTLVQRSFDDDAVRLLQLVADRAALAIENARLTEQRALTEVLQRTLLPEALPEIPGLRLSAKYVPTTAGLKLGGDWYDVLTLPDGRVGFVIGDAVGHGVAAASVMAEVRTSVRAYAMERHPPIAIVSLINELLAVMGRDRSATLTLAVLDFEDAELEVISAGHLPSLLRHPDGAHDFVGEASGPPLGAFTNAQYASERLPFPTGSSLLLYTDGLVERRDRSLDAGLVELAAALPASSPGAPGTLPLAEVIFDRLYDEAIDDDVALLAVESIPMVDTLELDLDATPIVLSPLRRAISRWLAVQGATEVERFDLTLAVSEAAANAIEHAYGPRRARFTISCSYRAGTVTVSVSDWGTWRSPQGRRPGRGIALMSELSDDVLVDRHKHGTILVLKKRLERGA
jgi:serine phosphatase RsbU (regulator of sigma subunit)/anti-sigma regulatory factor (Ser/Thr protein kinase)